MTEEISLPYLRRESAERAVLGAALIDPACIGVVMAGTGESEFDGHYRTIYRAVREAFNSGDPVDVVTVGARLGPDYNGVLMQLMQETPTAANVEVYMRILREQTTIARAQELGAKLSGRRPLYTRYALQTVAANGSFSCEKAESELGYTRRPLAETVRDTVGWLRAGS